MRTKNPQYGAAAIEFAILFPIFFLIFYAIVTYGLIFAAQQTLTLAAAEGARAAVRYPVAAGGGTLSQAAQLQARLAAACSTASVALDWLRKLGAGLGAAACGNSVSSAAGLYATSGLCGVASFTASNDPKQVNCVTMQVNYSYATAPLIPKLLGPLMSLPTPNFLHGKAVVQINLMD
ncbi:TadE family protein [Comamonas guangdongensis]|uniref:TadE family protein n=1 Tax=Comamonas guangdongensis TaxID=510515 RepID=A0ABV3ZX16_9BURK